MQEHDPESWDLNRNRKKSVSPTFFTGDNKKKNSVKDTNFEMPRNAQIFAAYTTIMSQ